MRRGDHFLSDANRVPPTYHQNWELTSQSSQGHFVDLQCAAIVNRRRTTVVRCADEHMAVVRFGTGRSRATSGSKTLLASYGGSILTAIRLDLGTADRLAGFRSAGTLGLGRVECRLRNVIESVAQALRPCRYSLAADRPMSIRVE